MGFWDKVKDIVFVSDEDDFEEEIFEETEQPVREKVTEESLYETKKEAPAKLIKSKNINSSGNPSMHVILEKPTCFDEVTDIVDKLSTGKAIVLNLEKTPKDIQQRIVDFLGGAAYARGGKMRNISKNIFIVAARGVDVIGEFFSDDFDDDRIYF